MAVGKAERMQRNSITTMEVSQREGGGGRRGGEGDVTRCNRCLHKHFLCGYSIVHNMCVCVFISVSACVCCVHVTPPLPLHFIHKFDIRIQHLPPFLPFFPIFAVRASAIKKWPSQRQFIILYDFHISCS